MALWKNDEIFLRCTGIVDHIRSAIPEYLSAPMGSMCAYQDITLEYDSIGEGHPIWLAFHGHGRSNQDLLDLADALPGRVIAVNLPHHGRSSFPRDRWDTAPWREDEFRTQVSRLLEKEGVERFSVIGYSLGGRFAMQTLVDFHGRMDKLILLAPDGMTLFHWYTHTASLAPLRWLFRRIVDDPRRFLVFARTLSKMRMLHPKLLFFLEYHLTDRERRELAFRTWCDFRRIVPAKKKVRAALLDLESAHLVVGAEDKVIKPSAARKFARYMRDRISLHLLDMGHDFFRSDRMQEVKTKLKQITR